LSAPSSNPVPLNQFCALEISLYFATPPQDCVPPNRIPGHARFHLPFSDSLFCGSRPTKLGGLNFSGVVFWFFHIPNVKDQLHCSIQISSLFARAWSVAAKTRSGSTPKYGPICLLTCDVPIGFLSFLRSSPPHLSLKSGLPSGK